MPSPLIAVSALSLALALLTALLAGLLWRARRQRRVLEAELARETAHHARLREAQTPQLEAIGQLAAGIAHEINTPTQYIGDNLRFLQEGFDDLGRLLAAYRAWERATIQQRPALEEETRRLRDELDLDYLTREIPGALTQSLEGVARVAEIVQAMKQVVHPGGSDKVPLDLNAALVSALNISRHEWKYVAETDTRLDPELPRVPALAGELSQVLLNIILNAVHAMKEARRQGRDGQGTLTVTTRRDGDWVEARIGDTGTGIPPALRERIFEPFFTTKEPGKGTGQGLAIARSVVERHGGTLAVDSEEGMSSTFIVRLPLTPGE